MAHLTRKGYGPRSLSKIGCSMIAVLFNDASENFVYTAYAVLDYCRRRNAWVPFSEDHIKKHSEKKTEFQQKIQGLKVLRDAGLVEMLDRQDLQMKNSPDVLYRVTEKFKKGFFSKTETPTPISSQVGPKQKDLVQPSFL